MNRIACAEFSAVLCLVGRADGTAESLALTETKEDARLLLLQDQLGAGVQRLASPLWEWHRGKGNRLSPRRAA